MPAILKFYDANDNEIDLSTGFDFGLSRKGIANMVELRVRNVGNIAAKDIMLAAVPQNLPTEVSEEEYHKQNLAAQWKSFGLDKDSPFSGQLNIGDIRAQEYLEGKEDIPITFDPTGVDFSYEVEKGWTSGTVQKSFGELKLSQVSGDIKDGTGARLLSEAFKNVRDTEVRFKIDCVSNPEGKPTNGMANTFAIPVRMNSKNDDTGYIMMLTADVNNPQRFNISIYRGGRGFVDHYVREYGELLFRSEQTYLFDPKKEIVLKTYNNRMTQPTFEFIYGGTPIKLGNPAIESSFAYAVSDKTDKAYVNSGGTYFDMSITSEYSTMTVKDVTIRTEKENQPIYIKSILDDRAEDAEKYKCKISISYIEG